MNLEGIALKLLLEESDKDVALGFYSELRAEYFSNAFASILTAINDFYNRNGTLPSLEDLKVFRSRDKKILTSLSTLSLIDTSGIDLHFVSEELANQHAQNFTLDLIDNVLKTISIKDRYDLLEAMGGIPLKLEEAIKGSDTVHTARTLSIFKKEETVDRFPSGISNEWDASAGGYYLQDLILLGGKRGSGKSVVCANLMYAQHLQKKPSVYFSIEMTAQEVYNRFLAIKAGVPAIKMKMDTLSIEERKKICLAAADLFISGISLYKELVETDPNPDFAAFEEQLKRLEEKDEGRVIIHHDRTLSLATIDLTLTTLKNKYGDDLLLGIVDYVNQVIIDGKEDTMYDWKDQTTVAKQLKNLAGKHNICIVSPYQMDAEGKARFSQGILDACDVAQLIFVDDKETGHIQFETTKARSADDTGKYRVSIDWTTLRIDPRPVVLEEKPEEDEPKPSKKKKSDEDTMELRL